MSLNSILKSTIPMVLGASQLYSACIPGEARVGVYEANKEKPYRLEVCMEQPNGRDNQFGPPTAFRVGQALGYYRDRTDDTSYEDMRRALEAKPTEKVYLQSPSREELEPIVKLYEEWSEPDGKEHARSLAIVKEN